MAHATMVPKDRLGLGLGISGGGFFHLLGDVGGLFGGAGLRMGARGLSARAGRVDVDGGEEASGEEESEGDALHVRTDGPGLI